MIRYVSTYTKSLVLANVTNCLNSATTDAINKYKEIYKDFINVEYGDSNIVKIVNINMLYVNTLQRDIAEISLDYLMNYCSNQNINIPSGAFLGGIIFAGKGKKIDISLIPIGATSTSYDVKYESVGVNSTKYSLYINVDAIVKIVVPFYVEDVNVSTTVLVVESIIQGEVPPYLLS